MSVSGPRISHLSEVAETLRDDALSDACQKVSVHKAAWPLTRLFCDIEFVDRFKYSLSKSLCEVLSAHDPQIQEIHYFDPYVAEDNQPADGLSVDASLHLLACINRSSAALEMFIAALDQALMECLKELPTSLFLKQSSVIDINLITDEDVRLGRGHAALLSSMYTPPLKIWDRNT